MSKRRDAPNPAAGPAPTAAPARPAAAASSAPDVASRATRTAWVVTVLSLMLAAMMVMVWLRAYTARPDAQLASVCFAGLDELAGCYNRLGDRDGELGAVKGLTGLVEKKLLPDDAGVGADRLVVCGTLYARRAVLEEDLKQVDGARQSYAEAAHLLRAVGWKDASVTPEALRTFVDKLNADRREAASATNHPPATLDLKLGVPRPKWR
jgi:hypothetical protein